MALPTQYSNVITVEPTTELMTTDEAKAFMRVRHDVEDDLIAQMNTSARKKVESFTSRQLITATYALRMDCFVRVITPPRPPLQSVTSLVYVDQSGNSQTLVAGTDYTVDPYSTPGRVVPAYNADWPSTLGHINDVTMTYVAGYGDAATDVPADLLQAHRLILAHYYEHREQFILGESIAELPTANRLMWEYREGGKR
jgi:uncharacterized phiE125 gp8 family phage protein